MKIAKANELYFEVPNGVWYEVRHAIDVYYLEKALFAWNLYAGKIKLIGSSFQEGDIVEMKID